MKVLVLSDARSIHTKRWVSSLAERGIMVVLYSINLVGKEDLEFYSRSGVECFFFDLFSYKTDGSGVVGAVRRHLAAVADLKRVIASQRPDILHSHYLTSYSFIAALAAFHPFVVSMWGSDVYEFPRLGAFQRWSVKFVLRRADRILSTSEIMASEARKYTSKEILITPFGVDTDVFRRVDGVRDEGAFVVGTVKTLSKKYGVDVLISAFRILSERNVGADLRLVIAGKGPDREALEAQAVSEGVGDRVRFVGEVLHSEVAGYYNSFDVAAFLSLSESFGVSAVEAMACGCAVVVSDADGFREVVEDGVSGFIVPKNSPEKAADAIQRFLDDPSLRDSMGEAARERVCRFYEWGKNVDNMISIYKGVYE